MHILRYYLRLLLAFLSRYKGIILLSSFAGIIILFLYIFISPLVISTKTEVIGITGRFHVNTLPDDILNTIGLGLTKIDDKGIPQPGLAISWGTDDKGKTWKFKLNESVYWHDGKPLQSQDIKYNFSEVNVTYPSSDTIIFNLKEPYIAFPSVVSRPVFKKGLLGTGSWKVDKITVTGEYIQKIILIKGKSKIIYKFYPSEDQVKFAYKMGEINKMVNVLNPQPFDKWINSKVTNIVNKHEAVVIFFNTQDPVLSEKNIRQALSYAINKDILSSERAISPIDPNSFAFNPQVKLYDYDPARSREIITALPKEVRSKLNVKLVSTPSLIGIAEKIVKDWKDVGVDGQALVSSVIPTDYQAHLTIFDIPTDPDQYTLWHSTQIDTNITKYKNPRIDKLLEDGRTQENFEERKRIYVDFQKYLLEDAPAIFLYHPNWYNLERK